MLNQNRAPLNVASSPSASPAASLSNNSLLKLFSLPNERPIMDYATFRRVSSWEELVNSYHTLGVSFSDEKSYLDQAKKDWNTILSVTAFHAEHSPLPFTYPCTTVSSSEKPIEIFGIMHSISSHPEVQLLLHKTLSNGPQFITEQNLGIMNHGIYSQGIDIPDHLARGLLYGVGYSHTRQLLGVQRFIGTSLRRLTRKSLFPDVLDHELIQPESSEGKALGEVQKRLGIYHPHLLLFSRIFIAVPGDWGRELPTNVELAYKHHKKSPYSMTEARSAYMAEFLRHWNGEWTGQKCEKLSAEKSSASSCSPKRILCGKAHEPEIAFFLEHGSRELSVTDRAKRDAEILNTKGIEGFLVAFTRRKLAYNASGMALSVAEGLGAGWGLSSLFSLF